MNSPKFSTFNGWGNMLYGHKPTPRGYVATEWVVVFYIPVIPVKSYEVLGETGSWGRKSYRLNELPELCRPQMIMTGLIGWSIMLFVILAIITGAMHPGA
jgi:hypothetical protein